MQHISAILTRLGVLDDPRLDDYIAQVEAVLGHSLDGDYNRDGHSIDNAIAFFRAGVPVDDFVTVLTSRMAYKLAHPRAIAVRCVKAVGPFVYGDTYLAVPAMDETGHAALYFPGACGRPFFDPAFFVPLRARNRGHFPRLALAAMGAVTAKIEPRDRREDLAA
jgi:hypothetical protein